MNNQLAGSLKAFVFREISRNKSVKDEIGLKNMRRLYYFSIIAMTIDLALVLSFIPGLASAEENELKWRLGIIGGHLTVFTGMGICCYLSYIFLKKKEANLRNVFLTQFAVFIIMAAGIWLTAMDQLVTPNITPYILVCNIIALVFLIRPYYAAGIYAISYGLFYYAAGVFQENQEILLSNRVNGLAAAGIGLCISAILWRAKTGNVLYKRQIEAQKKELEQKNLELGTFAFLDPLTNLYNRRSSERIFLDEVALINRYKNESCMIIVDLDYFKKINDVYGHPHGDLVLKEIAGLFLKNIRETDKAFRWGGDEFLILLPNTTLDKGEILAEKLRWMIEENVIAVDNEKIYVTASFGVVSIRADKDNSLETVYKCVDESLYRAKRKGRNRVETEGQSALDFFAK